MTQYLSGWTLAFDLDGTLIDSAPDIIEALNVVLREEGITPYALDAARPLIGHGALELMRRGFTLAGATVAPEREPELLKRLLDYYEAHINAHSMVYPGLTDALDRLEARGARFVVCTNKHTYLSEKLLDAFGLRGRFGAVRGADSVPAKKPDAGHLRAVVEDIGGDMAKTIMVGDSETDFYTAVNAGVPSILVSFGYNPTPITDYACTRLIHHYDELDAAVAVCVG